MSKVPIETEMSNNDRLDISGSAYKVRENCLEKILGNVTCHPMVGLYFPVLWLFLKADLFGIGTACIEITPYGRICWTGYIPFQDDMLTLQSNIWIGDRYRRH
jgi:hypothetical protein